MRRDSSVRIGMFWRFGSDDESRPVAAPPWWKVVWMRPSRGSTSSGSASTYVPFSFDERAVLEHEPRQRVLVGELLEHVLIGGRARS